MFPSSLMPPNYGIKSYVASHLSASIGASTWKGGGLTAINANPEMFVALAKSLRVGDLAAIAVFNAADDAARMIFLKTLGVQQRVLKGVMQGALKDPAVIQAMRTCEVRLASEHAQEIWREKYEFMRGEHFANAALVALRFLGGNKDNCVLDGQQQLEIARAVFPTHSHISLEALARASLISSFDVFNDSKAQQIILTGLVNDKDAIVDEDRRAFFLGHIDKFAGYEAVAKVALVKALINDPVALANTEFLELALSVIKDLNGLNDNEKIGLVEALLNDATTDATTSSSAIENTDFQKFVLSLLSSLGEIHEDKKIELAIALLRNPAIRPLVLKESTVLENQQFREFILPFFASEQFQLLISDLFDDVGFSILEKRLLMEMVISNFHQIGASAISAYVKSIMLEVIDKKRDWSLLSIEERNQFRIFLESPNKLGANDQEEALNLDPTGLVSALQQGTLASGIEGFESLLTATSVSNAQRVAFLGAGIKEVLTILNTTSTSKIPAIEAFGSLLGSLHEKGWLSNQQLIDILALKNIQGIPFLKAILRERQSNNIFATTAYIKFLNVSKVSPELRKSLYR